MVGTVALIYALAMAQQLLFVAIAYPLAVGVGAGVKEIAIGAPAVVRVRRKRLTIAFGPLPSSWVEMSGAGRGELSLARRLAVRLGPWCVALGVAIACLGPMAALRSFGAGFHQVVLVADPRPLVAAFFTLARTAPLHITFGVLLTKVVALNLLPCAGLAGGAVLDEVVWREPPRWWLGVSLAVLLIWILGRFAWAIASVVL